MLQSLCPVTSLEIAGPNMYVLSFHAPEIARSVQPGQFVNVKVNEYDLPLLRRPFSVYHVSKDEVKVIFNVIGVGTKMLSSKKTGEILDVIGPLGHPFTLNGDYQTAILVGGGLGVAPLPMLTRSLTASPKDVVTFLGARTANQLVDKYLSNVNAATDDGTTGYRGTVIDLLRTHLTMKKYTNPKIFACGPNPMLKNLTHLAEEFRILCEISVESAMACGIGICQGCPVEQHDGDKKYALICKDGPIFEAHTIRLS